MCFSPEASLAALIAGLGGSYLVYGLGKPTDKILALFLGFVSLMQGIEFILWNHQTCDDFHKNVSVLGFLLNYVQPIVLGIVVLALSPRQTYRSLIIGIMFTYGLVGILMQLFNERISFCTTPRPDDPHLVWNWLNGDYYEMHWLSYTAISISILILGMPTLNTGIFMALVYSLTMAISKIIYKRESVGSMWCFFTAFSPFIYYISKTMFIKGS